MSSSVVPDGFPEVVRTEWKLVCLLRVNKPDMPVVEIADRLGYNAGTVRVWLKNPAYQRYENWVIERMADQLIGRPVPESPRFRTNTVPERFEEYAAAMQEGLLDIFETTKSDGLRVRIAERWLDTAGHGPKARQEAGLTLILTPDVLLMLEGRAREAGLPSVINVTPAGKLAAAAQQESV